MKRNYFVAAFFVSVLLISLLALPAKGQLPGTGNTITGFVFDPHRRAVAQVHVELLNDVNGVLQRIRTDVSGRFIFRGVSQGRFQVRVLPLGTVYEEQTQEVDTTGRLGRDTIQIDFYLRLRKSAVASSAAVIFAQEVPDEAKVIYQRAVADLDRGRMEDGIAGLENSLKIFPEYYLALERLGLMHLTQQKYEHAVAVFNKAVVVNPRSFNAWYGLSVSHYELKQSESAVEAAQKAVSLNSNSADALLALGVSLRQAKRYVEAEKPLKQADKITKGLSPDVHWNLALLYGKNLNRFHDAANELELYLKTTPDTSQAELIKKLIKQYRESPPAK
ncbi:MAG TPA: tetratricopeptide repeat protein [Pyrinomonadaceae bacterium]|nr:tetratricopeptide repeat protein [Pyrinomonadaceae bacterium]